MIRWPVCHRGRGVVEGRSASRDDVFDQKSHKPSTVNRFPRSSHADSRIQPNRVDNRRTPPLRRGCGRANRARRRAALRSRFTVDIGLLRLHRLLTCRSCTTSSATLRHSSGRSTAETHCREPQTPRLHSARRSSRGFRRGQAHRCCCAPGVSKTVSNWTFSGHFR